tara:strand:+ start:4561 stop:5205 length:645 start_codon:yes stop_codon:yes gene_type:complete
MASINELKSLASRRGGFAQASQYLVKLPSLGFFNSRDLNLLCKATVLPGRQILTSDRKIGIKDTKVAYGYALDPLSMTFQVLNDYGVRTYFEVWQNNIIDQASQTPRYKSEYTHDVQIVQLRKGVGIDTDLKLGPFVLDIDIFKSANVIYECTLINAFPTTMVEMPLSQDGAIIELTVNFEYDNWRSSRFRNNPNTRNIRALGTIINTVNNIIN